MFHARPWLPQKPDRNTGKIFENFELSPLLMERVIKYCCKVKIVFYGVENWGIGRKIIQLPYLVYEILRIFICPNMGIYAHIIWAQKRLQLDIQMRQLCAGGRHPRWAKFRSIFVGHFSKNSCTTSKDRVFHKKFTYIF